MKDELLLESFESRSLDPEYFTHETHVRLVWLYLQDYPPAEVMIKMRDGLRRYTRHHGQADKYHETLTCAYVLLVAERWFEKREDDWPAFRAVHADLLLHHKQLISRYYTPDTLESARARQLFVLPDKLVPALAASD